MKQVLSLGVILCMIFCNFSISYAEDDYEYLDARSAALQTDIGKKYLQELENIIPQLDSEKLNEVLLRVKYPDITNISSNMYDFLYFTELLIQKELSDRYTESIPTLTTDEKLLTQREIMKLQDTLAGELEMFLKQALLKYSTMSSYKEEGDFSMNIDMELNDSFTYSLAVELEDYILQAQSLDQSIESSVETSLDINAFGEEISFDGFSDVNLIVKDGIYYLKMNNTLINLSEAIPKEFEALIKKLNTLGSNNTYIAFEDDQLQNMLRLIENVLQSDIHKILQETSSVQFFEAYSKTEKGYLLRPTIEFCNLAKQGSSLIFGFLDSNCSEAQYENMLTDLQELGMSLVMEIGVNNSLTLSITNIQVDSETILKYSDYGVISLDGYILEPGNADINNINYSYIPKKLLSFSAMIEETFEMNINMRLSNRVLIKSIDVYTKIYDSFNNQELTILSKYSGNKINGSIEGFSEGEAINCNMNGELSSIQGNINLDCSFTNTDYFSGEQSMYNIISKGNYDLRSNRNNLNFDASMNTNDNTIFKIELRNKGERKSIPKRNIPTPSSFIPSNEVQELKDAGLTFGISNNYSYDDEYIYDEEYEIETTQYDEYSETCYSYSDGSKVCDEYHNDYSKSCYYYENKQENYCSESHDNYYYDGYNDMYYYDDYEIDGKTGVKTEYDF